MRQITLREEVSQPAMYTSLKCRQDTFLQKVGGVIHLGRPLYLNRECNLEVKVN